MVSNPPLEPPNPPRGPSLRLPRPQNDKSTPPAVPGWPPRVLKHIWSEWSEQKISSVLPTAASTTQRGSPVARGRTKEVRGQRATGPSKSHMASNARPWCSQHKPLCRHRRHRHSKRWPWQWRVGLLLPKASHRAGLPRGCSLVQVVGVLGFEACLGKTGG